MITLSEFVKKTSFSHEEVLAFAHGTLISDTPVEFAKLPTPPMLMMDRVTKLEKNGKRGLIVAEKDIRFDDWFFQCHFVKDPVQPGVLGVDAVWQLVGFYCASHGIPGTGRALSCNSIEFYGQIRPYNKLVRYEIDIRRYAHMPDQGAAIAIANAMVYVDDELVYVMKDMKAGVFTEIAYSDYPERSKRSVGGILTRL